MISKDQKEKRFTTATITLFTILCAGIIAGSVILYQSQRNSLTYNEGRGLLSIAELKSKQISDFRKERYSEARFLYNNHSFIAAVKAYHSNPRSKVTKDVLDDWLSTIQKNHNYESISIMDTNGRIFYMTNPVNGENREDVEDVLKEDKIRFGDLHWHNKDSSIHLDVFVPLILTLPSSVEKIGVVNFRINPEYRLFDLIQSFPVESRTGEVLLVKKDGNQVVFLNELRFKKHTALKLKYPLSDSLLPAVHAVRGDTGLIMGKDYRGHEVMAALKHVPDSDWYIEVKRDTERIYAPLTSKATLIFSLMVALLAAAGTAFFIVWRGQRMRQLILEVQSMEAVKRLSRVYQVLSNVNQAIVRISDRDQLMHQICSIAVQDGGYRLCWIGFINTTTMLIEPTAMAGVSDYLKQLTISADENNPAGQGPTGRAVRSGKPAVFNDTWSQFTLSPWKENAIQFNIRSSAAFPLVGTDGSFGAINFYSDQVDFFTHDEIGLLDELSQDLAYALQNVEMEKMKIKAEEAQHESDSLLKAVMDNLPIGIAVNSVDPTVQFDYMNDAFVKCYRTTREALSNEDVFWNVVYEDEIFRREIRQKVLDDCASGDPGRMHWEDVPITRRGEETTFISAQNIPLPDKNLMISLVWDITVTKKAKQDLQDSEARYRLISENSTDVIWLFDLAQLKLTYVSPSVLKLRGFTAEEVLNQNMSDILTPDSLAKFYAELEAFNSKDRTEQIKTIEMDQPCKDGHIVHTEIVATVLRDAQNNPTQVLGVSRDITERRRAEENLYLQSSALNAAANGIVITDHEGTIQWVNPAFSALTGYTRDEAVGKNPGDLVKSGKLEKSFYKHMWDTILSGNVWSGEIINRRKDGTLYTEEQTITPLRDAQGKISHFIGIKQDITEKRKSEEAIRISNERFNLISRATNDGIWDWNIITNDIWWNDRFHSMLGFTQDTTKLSLDLWTSKIHPSDKERVINHLHEAINGISLGWSEEFRIQPGNDSYGYMFDRAYILRNENGTAVRMIGSMTDITERKTMTEALIESEAKVKTILGSTADGILAVDHNGSVITANQRFYELWRIPESIKKSGNDQVLLDFVLDQVIDPGAFLDKVNKLYASDDEDMDILYFKDGRIFERFSAPLLLDNQRLGRVWSFRNITARKKAEEALMESELKYKAFFEDDLTGDYITTPQGHLLSCNPAFAKMFGYESVADALLMDVHALYPDNKARENLLNRLKKEKRLEYYSSELVRKDGKKIYVIENMVGKFDKNGRLIEIKGYLFDDTQRQSLEKQLIQAQKMESLGTLAGGIAHDFNNILAIIMGHTSLIHKKSLDNEYVVQNTETITKATQRGAALVKQLLTFARKTDTVLESILIQDTIHEIRKFIEQTFPKNIDIQTDCEKDLPPILADATQIHQVLLNLSINARDAMLHGGILSITAGRMAKVSVAEKLKRVLSASEFILVKVTDTGTGMDESTKNRIFEPFFTTKGRERGTGLGLATVYGIVESHHGYINVDSEPGKGTSFNLYFPVQQSFIQHEIDANSVVDIPGGDETVLVVDDEQSMRYFLESIFTEKGYHVLSAGDGQEALEIYKKQSKGIDLVITDMGLPKMSGEELVIAILHKHPQAKVIVASGYFETDLKQKLTKAGVKDFVQKPYSPDEILQKVREVFDKK